MEKLQQSLLSLESEAELLRSQLHAINQEKLGHAQEVTVLQKELQDAQKKVSTGITNPQEGVTSEFPSLTIKPNNISDN